MPSSARRRASLLLVKMRFKPSLSKPFNRPGIHDPLSNVGKLSGARGGDVTIERRGRDAEAVRDLGHADVGIGQQRLGGLTNTTPPGPLH